MGLGSSWKLSGGRKLSAGVTKVSKKRQVRRDASRRAMASAGERVSTSGRLGGRLIQRATAGAAIHRATKGVAANNEWGLANNTANNAARANKTLAIMRLYMPKIFKSRADLAWAAVTHCSKFLPDMNILASVRKIASNISHPW